MDEQIRFATPRNQQEYVALLTTTLQEKYGNQEVEAVVIAIPGIIKDGVALWCNNLKWSNFDVARALKGVLGTSPVYIENDANLAGLSETRALRTIPRASLYVTVSTGIGTGIITDGTINAGLCLSEGGRSLVEYDGRIREWESFASGQAIYQTYGKYARDIHSKRAWKHIADRISRGFLTIIPLLQPEIIIIGGSIGTYFERYGDYLTALLEERLPPHIPCPRIIQAKHPEEAVVYGCYYYALDQLT